MIWIAICIKLYLDAMARIEELERRNPQYMKEITYYRNYHYYRISGLVVSRRYREQWYAYVKEHPDMEMEVREIMYPLSHIMIAMPFCAWEQLVTYAIRTADRNRITFMLKEAGRRTNAVSIYPTLEEVMDTRDGMLHCTPTGHIFFALNVKRGEFLARKEEIMEIQRKCRDWGTSLVYYTADPGMEDALAELGIEVERTPFLQRLYIWARGLDTGEDGCHERHMCSGTETLTDADEYEFRQELMGSRQARDAHAMDHQVTHRRRIWTGIGLFEKTHLARAFLAMIYRATRKEHNSESIAWLSELLKEHRRVPGDNWRVRQLWDRVVADMCEILVEQDKNDVTAEFLSWEHWLNPE